MAITLTGTGVAASGNDPSQLIISYTRSDSGATETLTISVTGNTANDQASILAAIKQRKALLNEQATITTAIVGQTI